MAGLVQQWCKYKLGLVTPRTDGPRTFEKDLSNGVIIAEVLRKYGVLSDDEFISLRHNHTKETRLNNIAHIKKWLIGSGLGIKDSDLDDVAKAKPGVAARLLYHLHLLFNRGHRHAYESGDGLRLGMDTRYIPLREEKEMEGSLSDEMSEIEFQKPKERPYYDDDKEKKAQFGKCHATMDRVEFAHHTVLEKPYVQSGEAFQVEHLYFNQRACEVIEKQEAEIKNFARERSRRLQEFAEQKRELFESFSTEYTELDQLKLDRILARKKERIKEAKAAKLTKCFEDMDHFDWMIERQPESSIHVNTDGSGDPAGYELRMKQLKYQRKTEIHDEEFRKLFRKNVMNRMKCETPFQMTELLEKDVLNSLQNVSLYEKMLAEFIKMCYKEKDHYILHAIHEAQHLQKARDWDLAKEMHIKTQNEEFDQYAIAEEANPKKNTFEYVCRALEDSDLLNKLTAVGSTLRRMIDKSIELKKIPPPPPPCTPTTSFKYCKQEMDPNYGPIMVCEDYEDNGEDGVSVEFVSCRIMPPEDIESDERLSTSTKVEDETLADTRPIVDLE